MDTMEAYLAQQGMPQDHTPPQFNPQNLPEDEDSPLFHTDDFRMWCMKVIPCTKRFVHDWTVCPFAHAGEKAVRRDPRTNNYTGIACPDMKKNTSCIRGDRCPYAHNVFEYWLHPTRYRTQLCNDGPTCRRSICFFAHSLEQLRVPACKPYVSPEALARASLEAIHQNPHPLGAQLPNAFGPGQPIPQHAAVQQAALAALNGMASGKSLHVHAPNGMMMGHNGSMQIPGMGMGAGPDTPSYGQHIPRLSEYGSLPRWSDASTVPGGGRMSQRLSHDSRVSADYYPGSASHSQDYYGAVQSDLYGGPGSTRVSADMYAALKGAMESQQHAQQQQYHHKGSGYASPSALNGTAMASATPRNSAGFPRPNSTPESLGAIGADLSPRTSEEMQRCITLAEGGAAGPASSSSSPGPGAKASGTIGEGAETELAQSLASLKIAMTQQNIASSTGTNHEIVISTLHQILKGAIANANGDATALLAQNLLGDLMGQSVVDAACAASVATTESTRHSNETSRNLDISSNPSLESADGGAQLSDENVAHLYSLAAHYAANSTSN